MAGGAPKEKINIGFVSFVLFVYNMLLGRFHFSLLLLFLCPFSFAYRNSLFLLPLPNQSNPYLCTQPFYGRSFLGAEHLYEPHEGNDKSLWWMDEGVPQCKFSFLPWYCSSHSRICVVYNGPAYLTPKHHLSFLPNAVYIYRL